MLLYRDAEGKATAIVAKEKDAAHNLAILHEGDWSDHLRERFQLTTGEEEGSFRLKLVELDLEQRQLRLYMSQNLPMKGYCRPAELDAALWDAAGPPTEYTAYKHLFWNWIDLPTQMEIYEQHVDWLMRASAYLLQEHEWDLFYTQLHAIDYAQHIFWGGYDPLHPDFVAEEAGDYWRCM